MTCLAEITRLWIYIYNEVCRMSKKIKSLAEFVLPDPTMKVEVS